MAARERLIAAQVLDGSFADRENVREGPAEAPLSLARVLTGANFGKSLIHIAGD